MREYQVGDYIVCTDDYGLHSEHMGVILELQSGSANYKGIRHLVRCECGKIRGFEDFQLVTFDEWITRKRDRFLKRIIFLEREIPDTNMLTQRDMEFLAGLNFT